MRIGVLELMREAESLVGSLPTRRRDHHMVACLLLASKHHSTCNSTAAAAVASGNWWGQCQIMRFGRTWSIVLSNKTGERLRVRGPLADWGPIGSDKSHTMSLSDALPVNLCANRFKVKLGVACCMPCVECVGGSQ